MITGVYSIWGFVRPNNWLGYQTCGMLKHNIEYKMDDEDCGKIFHGYICGDIRTSWQSSLFIDLHKFFTVPVQTFKISV